MSLNKFFASLLLGGLIASPAFAEVSEADFGKAMEKYLQSEAGQEKVAKAVEGYFKSRREEEVKKQQAKMQEDMETQFKNPVKIEVGSSPVLGPPNARVTVIEFSDFQCPFCSRGKQTMEELRKLYPNDVKVVFKHLPLDFHPQAMPAAKAANAAGKQGKFWEMHDLLFEKQKELAPELYEKLAQQLGLNIDKFKKDMEDPENEKSIKADMEIARANGISGTPGFFVNGVAVRGAYPIDHFKRIVDRWLGNNAAAATGGSNKAS